MKNTLICIGAGKSQYPVISKSKECGYNVIAIDQNPKAPGFKIADEKINLSTFDATPLLKPIKSLSSKFNITGILNRSSGPPVITAARIAKLLQLPYYKEESAYQIVNKHLLMKECDENGIPAPKSFTLFRNEKFNIERIHFPCVVKPSLSLVGKSGITVVNNERAINDAIAFAFASTMNDYITIDEYIDGDDISMVSFVDNGELIPICLLDEINTKDINGKISGEGFAIPSIYEPKIVYKQVLLSCKKIIEAFAINRSPLMVSFRIDKNQTPMLIEIHLDLGGDLLIEKLFPKALDFKFLEYSIQLLAGEQPSVLNKSITPTAIIFDKGDALVNEKKNTIFQSSDRMKLESLIYSGGVH